MIEAANHHAASYASARTGRLGWFVAVSIAVHVGIFAVWQPDPPRWNPSAAALNVTLIDAESDTASLGDAPSQRLQDRGTAKPTDTRAADVRRRTTAGEIVKTAAAQILDIGEPSGEIDTNVASAQPRTVAASDAPIISSVSSPPPNTVSLSRDELLQRIQHQLALLRHYPPVARRRGWEGDVHLTFRVTEQGAINAIHVAFSSGFTLLDDNAVAALNEINNLLANEEVIDKPHDMNLAVKYRLIDG